MNLQLENKLAPATGSTAGIERAVGRPLAAEGARVIVDGRRHQWRGAAHGGR